MTFSKERFDSCVTEAIRCMRDGIEMEYDRAIFWASVQINELTKRPTAQPTDETCKWKRGIIGIINPHIDEDINWSELFTYCPTCGLRIEVVE